MSHTLSALRRFVSSTVWMCEPTFGAALLEVLELRISGHRLNADERQLAIDAASHVMAAAPAKPVRPSAGNIAVLPLYGLIAQKASMVNDMSGPQGTSTEAFGQAFDAAMADPNVSAIVIDVNSPGGTIDGVEELATKIASARGSKRIVAVANTVMASAAYWIASAADEIAATPSASVGSIGVYTVHEDQTDALAAKGVKLTVVSAGKYKAEGVAGPLSEDAQAALQDRVTEVYNSFTSAVAKNRGVTAAAVRGGYGEGRVLSARKAADAGMVDRVATLDEVIARLGSTRGGPKPGGRRADTMRRELALAEQGI